MITTRLASAARHAGFLAKAPADRPAHSSFDPIDTNFPMMAA
jgi:hypothetical protein